MHINADSKEAQFTVRLNGNPTTGYQWQVKQYDQGLFNLVAGDYTPANPQLIGGGGVMEYRFALKKGQAYPKNTTMVFTYVRPWDLSTATDKKVVVTFSP